jgi:hypothetical protein
MPFRDGPDRVLIATRILSAVIIPFLVGAFILLYFRPSADDTARLFAWRIAPEFTAMSLGSVYLGGAYFFLRAMFADEWHRIAGGFVPVGIFATLMGVATIIHWNRFIHTNVAFWLWAALYFTTPFLVFTVWWLNQKQAVGSSTDPEIARPVNVIIGVIGTLAAATSLFLFLFPAAAVAIWPWRLTELTARVTGAMFALGAGAFSIVRDRRWSSAQLLLEVALVMLGLLVIAAVRARHDFNPGNPLSWAFAVGFTAVGLGAVTLYVQIRRRQPH